MNKKSKVVKLWEKDDQKIKEWAEMLGVSKPAFMNKVINSDKINLQQKVMEEVMVRQEQINKKLGIKK